RRFLRGWRCRGGARWSLDWPVAQFGPPLCWREDAPGGEEAPGYNEGEQGTGSSVGESRASAILREPHAPVRSRQLPKRETPDGWWLFRRRGLRPELARADEAVPVAVETVEDGPRAGPFETAQAVVAIAVEVAEEPQLLGIEDDGSVAPHLGPAELGHGDVAVPVAVQGPEGLTAALPLETAQAAVPVDVELPEPPRAIAEDDVRGQQLDPAQTPVLVPVDDVEALRVERPLGARHIAVFVVVQLLEALDVGIVFVPALALGRALEFVRVLLRLVLGPFLGRGPGADARYGQGQREQTYREESIPDSHRSLLARGTRGLDSQRLQGRYHERPGQRSEGGRLSPSWD